MRAEDVPDAWVRAAQQAYIGDRGNHLDGMAAALAAVAPLIAAAERERCAQVAHQHGYDLTNLDERNGAFSAAAAIRALP